MSEQQTPERAGDEPEVHEPEFNALEIARARIAQLEDGWRRATRPHQILGAALTEVVQLRREQERARTAAGWLPVVDNLERALEHATSDPEQIVDGVRAVHQQALAVLTDLGFPRRDDTGRAFDPVLHEAIGTIADKELVPGTVAQVVRPGYGPDNEILRPAAVVVATRSD